MKDRVSDVEEQDMWDAHKFLARTDQEWALKHSDVDWRKLRLKAVIAGLKLLSEEKSNAAKEDDALASDRYKEELEKYRTEVEELQTLTAQRKSAERQFEAVRTLMASRRKA